MILTDAGPLIALLDRRDDKHHICADALEVLPAEPMLTILRTGIILRF